MPLYRPLCATTCALLITFGQAHADQFDIITDSSLDDAGSPEDVYRIYNAAKLTAYRLQARDVDVGILSFGDTLSPGSAYLSSAEIGSLTVQRDSYADLHNSTVGSIISQGSLSLTNTTVMGDIVHTGEILILDGSRAEGVTVTGTTGGALDSQLISDGSRGAVLTLQNSAFDLRHSEVVNQSSGQAAVNASGRTTFTAYDSHLSASQVFLASDDGTGSSTAAFFGLYQGSTASATPGGNLMSVSDNQSGTLLLDNGHASGNITGGDGAKTSVVLFNGSTLSTAFSGVTSLDLIDGQVTLTGDSTVGRVDMGGNTISFSGEGRFSTFKIDSLSGGGSFQMNTDVAQMTGDFVDVTGEATGSYLLNVANTGREPGLHDSILGLVRTGGGNATFALKNGGVDIGIWRYRLVRVGNEWGLAQPGQPAVIVEPVFGEPGEVTIRPIDLPEVPGEGEGGSDDGDTGPVTSASTDALLSLASVNKNLFYGELNALNGRARELQSVHQDGVWGTFLNNTQRLQGAWNSAYRLEQNGLMLGGDTSREVGAGRLAGGVFLSSSSGKVKHARGGNSNVDSWGSGLYTTLSNSQGWYADAVAKVNRFSTDLSAEMTGGEGVSGSWQGWGYGLSLEGGREISMRDSISLTPYMQMSGYRNQSKRVRLSNGMQADLGNGQSLRGELGARVAVEVNAGSMTLKPYMIAAVSQEFAESSPVRINDAYNFDNDYRGTTGRLTGGISAEVTSAARVWMEAGYARGERNESPVMANAGVRISF